MKKKSLVLRKTRTLSMQDAKKQDILIFKLRWKKTPSDNLKELLSMISKHRMKLNSHLEYPANFDLIQIDRKFEISDITMMGDAFVVANKLSEIRKRLTHFIDEYIAGPESSRNKFYEVAMCQFLIEEFLYQISFSEPNFYDPNKWYEVRFRTEGAPKSIVIPTNNLIFTDKAQAEITDHYNTRSKFLNNLLQFFNVKLAQLNTDKYRNEIKLTPKKDKAKEQQLLEVWVGLKEQGFLNHLEHKQEIAKQRKIFFEIFNFEDNNFNDKHSNLLKNKSKGQFLHRLADQVEKLTPPKKMKRKSTH